MAPTRGSRRKSTSTRSKSPVRKSPPKTRSRTTSKKKATPKRTPESVGKKSATPESKVEKNLAKKLESVADEFSHKLVVLRIQYTQLFILGVIALAIPQDVAGKLQLKPEFISPGLTLAMQWFGVSTIGVAMLLIAAAQGTAAEMKKALQYGMMFWILCASLTIHQSESCTDKMDSIYGVMVCLFNLSIALWACYFS
mmetsp:Transcript_20187/g.24479  ORF Transcript_20187/g.24479 Transcript_20187/m.24479 type:complete len:197 (+) Transcript_20187:396-986(+)